MPEVILQKCPCGKHKSYKMAQNGSFGRETGTSSQGHLLGALPHSRPREGSRQHFLDALGLCRETVPPMTTV